MVNMTAVFTLASVKISVRVALNSNKEHRGYMPYPDIFLKAASRIECIISTNAFIDGSKKTGFLACELFLEQNGYFIDPKPQ
jgi:prophage maintenance system killer protein